jgi:hypothetical protein
MYSENLTLKYIQYWRILSGHTDTLTCIFEKGISVDSTHTKALGVIEFMQPSF